MHNPLSIQALPQLMECEAAVRNTDALALARLLTCETLTEAERRALAAEIGKRD